MTNRKRVLLLRWIVAAFLLTMVIVQAVRPSLRFRQEMIRRGFPKSYATELAWLHWKHPAWKFIPLLITDVQWEDVVKRECSPSWNLVVSSGWAPGEWLRYGKANYSPYYAENAKAYDSGTWYQASPEAVAYFMDPRNFLNEFDVFMFETLEFDSASQAKSTVEKALSNSFMHDAVYDGGPYKFSDLLMVVGKKIGVSPIFLAGRLVSEQGNGSVQAKGVIGDSLVELYTNNTGKVGEASIWGNKYTKESSNTVAIVAAGSEAYNGIYNFFNMGAYGSGLFEIRYNAWKEAVSKDTCKNYKGPWNTQAKAIEGGAIKIKERYISSYRHTRYLQKFSVAQQAGQFRWKQYMQNIAAPLIESRNTRNAYAAADALDAPYRFLIPIFVGMPVDPSPDPAKGKSVYSPSR